MSKTENISKILDSEYVVMKKNGKVNASQTIRMVKCRVTGKIFKDIRKTPLEKRFRESDLKYFPKEVVDFMFSEEKVFKEVFYSRRANFISKCIDYGMYNQELGVYYSASRYQVYEYSLIRKEYISIIELFNASFMAEIITNAKLAVALKEIEAGDYRKDAIKEYNKHVSKPISDDSYVSLRNTTFDFKAEELALKKLRKKYRNIRYYSSLVLVGDNYLINTSEENFLDTPELNTKYMSKSVAEQLLRELCTNYNEWVQTGIDAIDYNKKKEKLEKKYRFIYTVFTHVRQDKNTSEIALLLCVNQAKVKRARTTEFFKFLVGFDGADERLENFEKTVSIYIINQKFKKSEPAKIDEKSLVRSIEILAPIYGGLKGILDNAMDGTRTELEVLIYVSSYYKKLDDEASKMVA